MRWESRYLLDILISFPVGFGSVVGWLGLTMVPVFLSSGTFVLFHSDCAEVSASLPCVLFLSVFSAAAVLIDVRWELLWVWCFPWLVTSRIFLLTFVYFQKNVDNIVCVSECVCVCVYMLTPPWACGGQGTTCKGQFSPSTISSPGDQLRLPPLSSSALAAVLSCWSPFTQLFLFVLGEECLFFVHLKLGYICCSRVTI